MYLMSVIKFPKWAINAITSQMDHFFWGDQGDEHKYHLAKWGMISQKKEFGGLGIPNLREFNMSLLASWEKRYFMDSDKNWVRLIDHKYRTNNPNLLWSRQGVGSPFWKGVTWAFEGIRPFFRWNLGNGNKVSFWDDTWVGDSSLKTQFWEVYEICQQQHCVVSQVWDGFNLKLTFNRCVEAVFMERWHDLIRVISNMTISNEVDHPVWVLESSGIYSVQSFYNMINWGGVSTPMWNFFWKIVVPHRYLVFLWLAFHNKILTRDNLLKRGWKGDKNIPFVGMKKILIISFYIVQLLNSFGVCSKILLGYLTFPSMWK